MCMYLHIDVYISIIYKYELRISIRINCYVIDYHIDIAYLYDNHIDIDIIIQSSACATCIDYHIDITYLYLLPTHLPARTPTYIPIYMIIIQIQIIYHHHHIDTDITYMYIHVYMYAYIYVYIIHIYIPYHISYII